MRFVIQVLAIVWTVFSLTVSWAFTDGEAFSSKKIWKSWIGSVQNIVLDMWNAKNTFVTLWFDNNLQIDEKQDTQEDEKISDTWKTWWSQYQYTTKYTYPENNISVKHIRQSNIVCPNFTDLVWIIKITI